MAQGGGIMGCPKGITQRTLTRDDPRPFDPQRDIMQFFLYMTDAISQELSRGSIPAFREAAWDVGREKINAAHLKFLELLSDAKNGLHGSLVLRYDDLVAEWLKTCEPQVVDVLLRLWGRALLQFYVECSYQCRINMMLDGDLHGTIIRIINTMGRVKPRWWVRAWRWTTRKDSNAQYTDNPQPEADGTGGDETLPAGGPVGQSDTTGA
jgi:hypothetical protein